MPCNADIDADDRHACLRSHTLVPEGLIHASNLRLTCSADIDADDRQARALDTQEWA
jgi:hypothetical protein